MREEPPNGTLPERYRLWKISKEEIKTVSIRNKGEFEIVLSRYAYEFNPEKTGDAIDLIVLDKDGQKTKIKERAIYSLIGDYLIIRSRLGDSRPENFSTSSKPATHTPGMRGTIDALWILRRGNLAP
jgi:hypothetical protein